MIARKEYINSIHIRLNNRLYYSILTKVGPELDQAALALLVSPITVTVAVDFSGKSGSGTHITYATV